jgi:CBS domain-containing protein
MSLKRDLRHARRAAVEQLTALRDEAKLQIHLLSMDARTRWNQLEQEISTLEEQAHRDGGKAADGLQEAAQRLTHSLHELMAAQTNHSAGLFTSVRSLMTSQVRTCHPGDSLVRAAQLMWESDCGVVPVVDGETVIGIITDRDVCMAGYTQGRRLEDIRVGSAMSKELFSCGPDDSVATALATMGDKRVRRLPILGNNGKLLGILALADVTRWARSLANPGVDAALTDALAAVSDSPSQLSSAAAE